MVIPRTNGVTYWWEGIPLEEPVAAGSRPLAIRTVRTVPPGPPCRCHASRTRTGATSRLGRVGVTSLKVFITSKALLVAVGLLLILSVTSAWASVTYTGTLTTADGLTASASGAWSSAALTFAAWQLSDSYWHYEYTVGNATATKSVSHLIVGASADLTEPDVRNLQVDGEPAGFDLDTFGDEGGSNPSIPGDVYGLKIGGTSLPQTFSFESLRAPAWVSAYAKDGKDGGVDQFLYTTGTPWGSVTDAAIPGDFVWNGSEYNPDDDHHGWVLGPDSKDAPGVPALALLGAAPFAAFVSRKLRRG